MGFVIFCVCVYLFVACIGGAWYHDFIRPDLTYVQGWATGALWPVLLPILLAKALFTTGGVFVQIAKEIPEAVNRVWRA